MSKRALAALLWFSAAWFGYEIVWSLTGVARMGGPILAFSLAAFVTVDPLGVFWPRRAGTRTGSTPIEASSSLA